MAMDRVRPYTYTAAMRDFKNLLRRVSPDDTDYGLHGLRVEGWNLAAAVDPELAEAHGGWKPGNASRYTRFNLASVFNLSRTMINLQAVPPPDTGADDDEGAPSAPEVVLLAIAFQTAAACEQFCACVVAQQQTPRSSKHVFADTRRRARGSRGHPRRDRAALARSAAGRDYVHQWRHRWAAQS
jgi:hypothetical protein